MGLKSQAFQGPISPMASLKVLYSLLKNGLLLPPTAQPHDLIPSQHYLLFTTFPHLQPTTISQGAPPAPCSLIKLLPELGPECCLVVWSQVETIKHWFMFCGVRRRQEDTSVDISQDSCDSRNATYHPGCSVMQGRAVWKSYPPISHSYTIGLSGTQGSAVPCHVLPVRFLRI